MWNQAYTVLNHCWTDYTMDQERTKPLVSTRFYTTMWAKRLPRNLMEMLVKEVQYIQAPSYARTFPKRKHSTHAQT